MEYIIQQKIPHAIEEQDRNWKTKPTVSPVTCKEFAKSQMREMKTLNPRIQYRLLQRKDVVIMTAE